MRAAVLHGKEDVRLEEVPERPLAPGEVRIRIGAALTCDTDLKVFKRGYHAKMIVPPAVFGHEIAGEIIEVRNAECGMKIGALGSASWWQTLRRVMPALRASAGSKAFAMTCSSSTALTPSPSSRESE